MPPLYAKFPYAGGSISGYSAYVPMCACMLSSVRLFATLWTVVHQAPLSMGFSKQEYWSRLPFPALGDLPNPGIKPASPALQVDPLLLRGNKDIREKLRKPE